MQDDEYRSDDYSIKGVKIYYHHGMVYDLHETHMQRCQHQLNSLTYIVMT